MTMESTSSDDELLERLKAGDDDALSELIQRYAPRVLRFGIKMCGHEDDAHEVLQDTLLAAARGLRDFRGQSTLTTWLYSIARSFCIKRRTRGSTARLELEPLDAQTDAAALIDRQQSPEERAQDREIIGLLEDAIAALDPAYREVLLLRDVEGLTAPEVAEVLGLGVDAVKSRLHRARAQVRQSIAPRLADPPSPISAAGCPEVVELLSKYLEGDIDAELCRELEAHTASCTRCAQRCDSLRNVLSVCRTLPAPELDAAQARALRESIRLAMDR